MMMVVVVKNVTRKNTMKETCKMYPFVTVYIVLERNVAIGVLDGSCTSREIKPSKVLWSVVHDCKIRYVHTVIMSSVRYGRSDLGTNHSVPAVCMHRMKWESIPCLPPRHEGGRESKANMQLGTTEIRYEISCLTLLTPRTEVCVFLFIQNNVEIYN